MKNFENLTQTENAQTQILSENLEFPDMLVYNEMADQTSVKLNLVAQIHSQLNQLDEMMHRRRFMMKEVLQHVVD